MPLYPLSTSRVQPGRHTGQDRMQIGKNRHQEVNKAVHPTRHDIWKRAQHTNISGLKHTQPPLLMSPSSGRERERERETSMHIAHPKMLDHVARLLTKGDR
jgi:hypothetical protein